MKEYGNNGKHAPLPLSLKAHKSMYNHHWPGNIRELQNTIHRHITLHKFDFIKIPPQTKEQLGDQDENSNGHCKEQTIKLYLKILRKEYF